MKLTKDQASIAIQELKEKLIHRFHDKVQLYLFGSVARGDFGSQSDIDLLIIIDGVVNYAIKDEIYDFAFDIELKENVVFGLMIEAKMEWESLLFQAMPIHQIIDREGIRA